LSRTNILSQVIIALPYLNWWGFLKNKNESMKGGKREGAGRKPDQWEKETYLVRLPKEISKEIRAYVKQRIKEYRDSLIKDVKL
jgi:hypothetical protein